MASQPPSATGPVGGRADDPPAQTNAEGLVARVNMEPEPFIEPLPGADAPADGARRRANGPLPLATSWGPQAIALGIVALIICVVALILILQGVFEVMPD